MQRERERTTTRPGLKWGPSRSTRTRGVIAPVFPAVAPVSVGYWWLKVKITDGKNSAR